ncbi:MAG: hypothetical protein ABIH47_07265 [Candidatus Omnitrophota bacterium]
MARRPNIRYGKKPCLIINRTAFRDKKLVYVVCANKKVRYSWDRSRIVYIGTTKKGANRIASSAAYRGEVILDFYGIRHIEVNIVTCGSIQGAEMWKKLERALLLRFKEMFGELPRGNKAGRWIKWRDERKYFRVEKLEEVIKYFS